MQPDDARYILIARGPSAQGQVAAITAFINNQDGYVEEFNQFDDVEEDTFFARACFRIKAFSDPGHNALLAAFSETATRLFMNWDLTVAAHRPRVLILGSKLDHCVRDLLYRWSTGELHMDVMGVVSNHENLAPIADAHGVPYFHLPVTDANRSQQETQLMQLFQETRSELMILARYMQVLSDNICGQLVGKAINIHHSFLPGFKGARPYHQAHKRGVKVIGATAHYITSDLDEGPIIDQVVERVDHGFTPAKLESLGRNCESVALHKAVKLHLERRVFLNGLRTVVFP
ncbi:formyltetrahydrofolate deformylase [Marinobacter sp.]|uniref:formyltetrahydrofolate deformylase n=1 Tax=Marinobacter sp. TaxID=50741 RepID=UPI00384CDBF3